MHWCYILYSSSLDKFYIGETENLDLRIDQHNSSFFKASFTSIASDWTLFLSLPCTNRIHARRVESFIKRMKSKKFIINLKNDFGIQSDIVTRFK